MNTKIEKVDTNVIKMEVTVEAEKFKEALEKSYAKNVKKFNVPGFRKGKAPMNIIKSYYGLEVLYEDAINFCFESTYPEALEENDIEPVDYPEIDIVDIEEGKDFIYSAEVTVYPEVELGEYKGLEVSKIEYPVTEEDLENELKVIQEQNARIETKEEDGIVEKGNIAVIDFKGFVDDVPFEGGEGKDYPLEIGSGVFIDDFEEQLIGSKINEEIDVNVTFPEDYGEEDLCGKSALFKVTVKEIKVKELPELDDEFATEVSEFDTLEEFKEDLMKNLEELNNKKAQQDFEDSIVDAVCNNVKVDIPEVMIDNEVDMMLKDLELRLQYQGLNLATYYQYTNSSEEQIKEVLKEGAEKRVKTNIVLDKIIDVEKLEATEEELLERAKEIAKMYGTEDLDKKAQLVLDAQRENLELNVLQLKAIQFLVDNAKITA